MTHPATAQDPLLDASDLRFGWPGGFGLRVARLGLGRGEKVLLLGESGSGKSTLLSALTGILPVTEGRIAVAGQDLARLRGGARDRHRAEHIGLIFQSLNLIPYLDAVQNVLLPLSFAPQRRARSGGRDEALALLSRLGLPPAAWAGKSAAQLSLGQQQRVAAARALIGGPAIVIADEPTSALDTANRTGFMQVLGEEIARRGTALLMVSHDLSLRPDFDRCLDMATIAQPQEPPP